jgi:hypothetical protein
MTAYLLITGIIGIGALIANMKASKRKGNQRFEDIARGPMDSEAEAHIKRMYFEKQRRAKIARDERMALAEGWGRYV